MMARSTNAPCKGRIQMRKTNPLHLLKIRLATHGRSEVSALPNYVCVTHKADINSRDCHVRLVPMHEIAAR